MLILMNEKNMAVFFDLDDTLISTSSAILKRLEVLLKEYQVQEGLLYVHNLITLPNRESIMAQRYDFAHDFWRGYELLRECIRPEPLGEVKTTLQRFRKIANLGILTNASRKKIEEALKSIGLPSSYFECGVYGREDLQHPKPDVRCLDSTGRPSVYVGDDSRDYLFSKLAGIPFISVCTGLTSRETFIYLGQEESRIFPSIHEVSLNGI